MMFRKWAVALAAAAIFACAPASAQKISELPAAATPTGAEQLRGIQGSGCATHASPCSDVKVSVAQIATFAAAASQPLDAELTALAGQTTAANRCQYWSGTAAAALYDCTGFVRGLGTSADAAAFRSAIGAAASGANSDITAMTGLTTPLSIAQGGTGSTTAAAARTALGVVQETVFLSGTQSSVTGTTAETTLATITVPANAPGPNGQIEIMPLFSMTSSANTKTVKITFGGTTYFSQTYTTVTGIQPIIRIANRNSASAQVGSPSTSTNGLNGFSTAPTTSSVNTGSSVTIAMTCQLANSAEACAVESYLVRITYGA